MSTTQDTSLRSCYFSLTNPTTTIVSSLDTPPTSPEYDSFDGALVTPDPSHPLLAICSSPVSKVTPSIQRPKMDVSKLLQLQTKAAHPQQMRPQPRPLQDVLHVSNDFFDNNSDDSITSNESDLSAPACASQSIFAYARCSRCQRRPSVDANTGRHNMIEYGLNLFYCTRCANMVGFVNR